MASSSQSIGRISTFEPDLRPRRNRKTGGRVANRAALPLFLCR